MANTEMIDQLVSDAALKSLDTLNVKLESSYIEMEKLLAKVQVLSTELSAPAKSYIELAKSIEKVEKVAKSKQKVEQEELKNLEESKKLIDEVIHSEKERTKAIEEQEKATKKLDQSTKELLDAFGRTAKGIDISAYIQENEMGMKNYSNAINAVNQQLGIINGLQLDLNDKLKEGAISEEEYNNAIGGLNQKQAEYEQTLISLHENYEKVGEAQRSVFNPASEAFNKLSSDVQEQTYLLVGMNAELNETRNSQKELDKLYKDEGITLDLYIQKKAQLNALEADQSKAVKDLSKELQLNQQIANTSVGSYDNLSARYSLMKIQINALGEAEGQNVNQKRALEKEAKALYDRMNDLQKATGKAQLQVGDYTLINKDLEGALNMVNPALGGTISGIQGATKAAMAFIATPIGLVLAAIAAALAVLTSWFTRTEEGQDALAVATAAFEKVLSSVLNVVDQVGEWLYKAFTSPKEAVKELGDLIVTNVINRLHAVAKIGDAVVKIFSEDWKQGFKDLGNATAQAMSGIEDPIDKINSGMNDMFDGIKRSAEIQTKLNELVAKKRNLGIEESKNLAEMNRLRNIASDQEKSSSERLAANNKYIEIANKLGEQNVSIAKETYELRKAQIEENKKGSSLSIEEKNEIAKLEADMYKADADHQQMLFTATRTNNRLRKEGINAGKEAIRERNKELKAIGELESFNYRKSADLQERIYKDTALSFEERKNALWEYTLAEIAIIQVKADEEVKQEGLTQTQIKLIKEKALYETYKLQLKYDKEIKDLTIGNAEDEVKKIEALISQRSEKLNEAMQNDLVEAAHNYEQQIKLNVNNEEKRTKITEEYQKLRLEIIRKYNQEAFDFEVDQLQKLVGNTEIGEEQKLNIQKKIDKLKKSNAKDMAEFEIKLTEEKVDKMLTVEEEFNKVMNDARTKALMEIWNTAIEMVNMYYDEQIKRIDELEKREQEYYDEKLKLIDENVEAGLISQEEAAARKRIIDETQLEREKQYDQQRKEIERKKALWNKANSIIQAKIATAQAVATALTAGPIIGPILAGIIGAMGAIQVAMIMAQQIPSYAKGTSNHPGGLARVGDGGKSEMVILPSGEVWKTPATDTFVSLPKGTEVLPDYRKAMMEMSTYPVTSYYDDDKGKMIYMNDEVLRNNTKEANNQLNSINRGINAIRYNGIYSAGKNNAGSRFIINKYN